MKRGMSFLLTVALLMTAFAMAEGFFPSTNELFGQAMPSLSSILNRPADEIEEIEGGRKVSYQNITAQDYIAFSAYLGQLGCVAESVDVLDGVLATDIVMDDGRITFTYDDQAGVATVFYPEGTREEDAAHVGQGEGEVLPDYIKTFGTGLPSMAPVTDRKPTIKTLTDGTIQYQYGNVSETEYDAFSRYLTEYGCVLTEFTVEAGVVTAELKQGGTPFYFEYDSNTCRATIAYPGLAFVEDNTVQSDSGEGLLPLADEAFGVVLPRIALATGLKSEGLVQTEEGLEESYQNFTEEQYNKFSVYLQEKGCAVVDYSTDANGVLTINLMKSGVPFTFVYDKSKGQATMRYALNSRPEPTPTPEPTAVPAGTPKPQETKSSHSLYSESDCWRTAENYFKNMSWKNPESLTIHGHTSSLSDGAYTFLIDYSAQNGFGGYNRGTGMVVVDADTNRVTSAWTF